MQLADLDDYCLVGKRALVCGSSEGIGHAAAFELACRGAAVTLLARNAAALEDMRGKLGAEFDQAHGVICADLAEPEAAQAKVAADLEARGPYHILVNNSGGPAAGPILDATPEQFLAAFRQHLIGNHLLAQTVIPGMRAQGYGRIINIVSTSVREPIRGLGVSNTIRGAVASWAKTLASEVAPFGITVNNVLPGFTDTGRLQSLIEGKAAQSGSSIEEVEEAMMQIIPAARFATAPEIAAMIGFLASPAATYVTGTSIPVDGGRTSCL